MRILELGCGDAPTLKEGYEYLDIRPLEHVNYVQDATDLSNFKDGEFDKLTSRDLIEHIPWGKVPAVLREWLRVVKPGGSLEIETPSAYELMEIVANPHNPALNRRFKESDFELFNRTAFGHQDYEGNQHYSYFTDQWLRILLLEAGATGIELSPESTFRRFRMIARKP